MNNCFIREVYDPKICYSQYDHLFMKYASEKWKLAKAIAYRESQYYPDAIGQDGEIGLMQVMPATARIYYGVSKAELFDPDTNIRVGSLHLLAMLDRYPDSQKAAICAYRAGGGTIDRLIVKYSSAWFSHSTKRTKIYFKAVSDNYKKLSLCGR